MALERKKLGNVTYTFPCDAANTRLAHFKQSAFTENTNHPAKFIKHWDMGIYILQHHINCR